MNITVDLPDTVLQDMVLEAWNAAFKTSGYRSDPGGTGRRKVAEQVERFVHTLDVQESIREQAALSLETIVKDEVGKAIQKMVGKQTREVLQKMIDIAKAEFFLEGK